MGLKTVMPPHIRGPADSGLIPSGIGIAQVASVRTRSANPPCRPTIIPSVNSQRLCSPPTHHSQVIQEFVCDYTECEDFELTDARILPKLAKAKTALESEFNMTGGWSYQLPMFRKGGE